MSELLGQQFEGSEFLVGFEDATFHLQGLEPAHIDEFARLTNHILRRHHFVSGDGGRIGVRVRLFVKEISRELHLVADLSAEEVVHRFVQRAADEVVEGGVDRAVDHRVLEFEFEGFALEGVRSFDEVTNVFEGVALVAVRLADTDLAVGSRETEYRSCRDVAVSPPRVSESGFPVCDRNDFHVCDTHTWGVDVPQY